MKNGNFLRKGQKRKNKSAIKRIDKKTRQNTQNDAIKPQKREKKLQKANVPAKKPDFTAISSKKTELKPRKNLREKAVRG